MLEFMLVRFCMQREMKEYFSSVHLSSPLNHRTTRPFLSSQCFVCQTWAIELFDLEEREHEEQSRLPLIRFCEICAMTFVLIIMQLQQPIPKPFQPALL